MMQLEVRHPATARAQRRTGMVAGRAAGRVDGRAGGHAGSVVYKVTHNLIDIHTIKGQT